MRVRILGAHNTESKNTRLSGLLIDEVIALDAGSITSSLSFPAQNKLRAVLLTHQHYDHIRDIPTLGINLFLSGSSIRVYTTLQVAEVLKSLLDGTIYPNYLQRPEGAPTLKLNILEPLEKTIVEGYEILPVPVSHSKPAVGYQVASGTKKLFYTGDTGPGLSECWRAISPDLLFIEVTSSNRFDEFGKKSKHMTPNLLKEELLSFRELKGYLPDVITVHMSPSLENEIRSELAALASELSVSLTLGEEDMELEI